MDNYLDIRKYSLHLLPPVDFDNEKHYKRYCAFIISRPERSIKKEEGFHIHHILPKSMGGLNNENNLIKLTYREHFIAHLMLWKCGYKEMIHAFSKMVFSYNMQRFLTSRQFSTFYKENSVLLSNQRKNLSLEQKESIYRKVRETRSLWSEEYRQEIKNKISESLSGREKSKEAMANWYDSTWDITEEEYLTRCKKIAEAKQKKSKEEKEAIAIKQKNTVNSKTKEEKERINKKISNTLKGRKQAEATIERRVETAKGRLEKDRKQDQRKRLQTLAEKSDEEKQHTKEKRRNTWKAKSKEDMDCINRKRKESMLKKEASRLHYCSKAIRCIETRSIYINSNEAAFSLANNKKLGYKIRRAIKKGTIAFGYHWEGLYG